MNPALSKRFIYFVPPLLFSIVAAAFLWELDPERDPREIPSVLIDDPVPDFSLPPIEGTRVPTEQLGRTTARAPESLFKIRNDIT